MNERKDLADRADPYDMDKPESLARQSRAGERPRPGEEVVSRPAQRGTARRAPVVDEGHGRPSDEGGSVRTARAEDE